LQVAAFVVQSLGIQQAALREKESAIADLPSKLEESSAARREADEKFTQFKVDLEQKLAVFRGRGRRTPSH